VPSLRLSWIRLISLGTAMRFPGQWFQMESRLAYNWHRHYDATTGRYVQPDPYLVDHGLGTIGGIPEDALPPRANKGISFNAGLSLFEHTGGLEYRKHGLRIFSQGLISTLTLCNDP
jgi:RHS repeat-associated protein